MLKLCRLYFLFATGVGGTLILILLQIISITYVPNLTVFSPQGSRAIQGLVL